MSYQVIARKYRPTHFSELIGQQVNARLLMNAIKQNKVPHAFLFCGPRGVGKTSAARIIAKALNCQKGPTVDPCNKCEHCINIMEGSDIDVIEIDGASNRGIDNIRDIKDVAYLAPSYSNYKIFIIDEVHMLTREAFNALLKILEEPPSHVKFIMATTEPEKLPDTIRSRCQRYDFKFIPFNEIKQHLKRICEKEKVKASDTALDLISLYSGGSMRDAQMLLDQAIVISEDIIEVEDINFITGRLDIINIIELIEAIFKKDKKFVMEKLDNIIKAGTYPEILFEQLIEVYREMLLGINGLEMEKINVPSYKEKLLKIGEKYGTHTIMYIMEILLNMKSKLRYVVDPRIPLEMAFLKLIEIENLMKVVELFNGASYKSQNKTFEIKLSSSPETSPIHKKEVSKEKKFEKQWEEIVNLVSSKKVTVGDKLKEAKPVIENSNIILHFRNLNELFYTRINESISLIEKCVEEVLGKKYKIKLNNITSQNIEKKTEQSTNINTDYKINLALRDPHFKNLKEKFSCKIINVKRSTR